MTREEAIKELRGFIGQLTEGCQEAIKVLFPELQESEDERIRKEILEDIRNVQTICSEEYRKKSDRWIAWLEKHKDSVSNAKYIEDVAHAFEDGRKKGIEEKQKEPKNVSASTMIPSCWEEEQKDNKFAPRVLPCSAAWFEDCEEKQKERKPAEWSEDIIRKGIKEVGLTQYQIKWLKNNVFPPKKEQKPEWSEEDKNKLNHIIEIVHIASGREASVDEKEELESFLKSLRPQPHWKPTEEQKPETKLTRWVARDANGEIYAYEDYPEKDFQMWIGSNGMILDRKSFPDLKWEDEPMEVEITIRKNNTLWQRKKRF